MPRLHHIDSLRAYAILMMLQGHFIYTMLAKPFHQADNFWYSTWMFGKGFTAPIFFTVTGLVLVYLILRKNDPTYQEARIKKALKRGGYLILWGYLLRTSIYALFNLRMNGEFWKVDVLHCIGIGMLAIVLLFKLGNIIGKNGFQWLLISIGAGLFIFEPITKAIDFSSYPLIIRNYFTREFGSLFIPFPWIGYTLIGGFIGTLYVKHIQKRIFGVPILAIVLTLSGLLLTLYSSAFLMYSYQYTGILLFKQIAYNNYLFIRLGHVFMFISLFIVLEKYLAQLGWFNKIGQATLNIYIVHFFLLYGTWFGLGLSPFAAGTFSPIAAIIGAICFMIITTVIALNVPQAKIWTYEKASLLYSWLKTLTWADVKKVLQFRWKKNTGDSKTTSLADEPIG